MSTRVIGHPFLFIAALLAVAPAFGQTQDVNADPGMEQALPSTAVDFDAVYTTTPPGNTTGIGVRLHFNSSQLTFVSLTNVRVQDNILGSQCAPAVPVDEPLCDGMITPAENPPQLDALDSDSDPLTDMFVLMAWFNLSSAFPAGPFDLYTANFMTTPGFTGTTARFSSSGTAAGRTFSTTQPYVLTPLPTPTPSLTPTITLTPSNTPTVTNTPIATNTPTVTNTPTITPTSETFVPEIPTLSGLGMALMVLLFLGIAALYLARQRS